MIGAEAVAGESFEIGRRQLFHLYFDSIAFFLHHSPPPHSLTNTPFTQQDITATMADKSVRLTKLRARASGLTTLEVLDSGS